MRLENLSQFGSFAILLAVMVIGSLAARASKGKIPSALVISAIMLIGFWTIFPLDIAERAGVGTLVYTLCAALIVTNLATLISKKEMAAQWRTVIIALLGIAAIIVVTLAIGSAIFGWNMAVAATPPLTGGAIATMLTIDAAGAISPALVVVALICFVVQGLIGYPLTSIFLGREARRLNGLYKEGKLSNGKTPGGENVGEEQKQTFFTKIKDPTWILLKLALVVLASYWLQILTGYLFGLIGVQFNISMFVWCLVLGFVCANAGILEKDSLAQAKSDGILMNLLLIYLFGSLSTATWDLFVAALLPAICFVLIAAAGMALAAFISSKIFKKNTFAMCYSIILNAFYGFPINVMLTTEAIEGATDDKDAQNAIRGEILPKMLVGGFTSVTVVSVVVAGVLINLFQA